MGTNSTKKFIKNNAGTLTEEAALLTSAGAADANKIPALNASGVLDATILNGVNSSAGAASAGKTPLLDAAGRLDLTMMPAGVAADVALIVASEALAAGDLVNIWNNSSVANVRKADGSTSGKEAHGYVLAAVASAGTATVYFEGPNTAASGMTPGVQFLSDTTAGKTQSTAPTGAGKTVQRVGFATSATSLNFDGSDPIALA